MAPSVLLRWPLVALRATVFGAPLLCTFACLGARNPLASLVLVAIWMVPIGQALSASGSPLHHAGIVGDTCLILQVAVSTVSVLVQAQADAQNESVWLLPLLAYVGLTGFTQLDIDEEDEKDTYKTIAYSRSWWMLLFLVVVVSLSLDAFFLAPSDAEATVGGMSLLASVALMVCVLVFQDQESTQTWQGGSTLVLCWAFLQACPLPLMDEHRQAVRLTALAMVLVAALGMATPFEASRALPQPVYRFSVLGPPIAGAWRVIQTAGTLVALVCTDLTLYMVVATCSLAVLVQLQSSVWYTAHVGMPDFVHGVGNVALVFIDRIVGEFYKFTNQSSFQKHFSIIVAELSALRGIIFRVISTAYPHLLIARDGKTATITPLGNMPSMVVLCAGPGVVAMGLLVQVFPTGKGFVRSKWFWAYGVFMLVLYIGVTHVLPGTVVTLFHFIFEDTEYTRNYTSDGWKATVAQCALGASCLGAFLVTGHADRVAAEAAAVSAAGGRPRRRPGLVTRSFDFITSPAFVIAALGICIIVLTALSSGSPFRAIDVERVHPPRPEWLISTDLDKVGPTAGKLLEAISPHVKMALLIDSMLDFGIEQMKCWTCFCLDSVLDVGKSISGAFGLRRRLLAIDDLIYEFNEGNLTYTGRSLLQSDGNIFGIQCNNHAPCRTTNICLLEKIDDVRSKVRPMILDGMRWATEFILKLLLKGVAGIADFMDHMLELPNINQYLDFDLFDPKFGRLEFSFRVSSPLGLDLDLGVLPKFKLPSFDLCLSRAALIALAALLAAFLALLYYVGVLEAVVEQTLVALELLIVVNVLSLSICLVCLAYMLREAMRELGFLVHVTFSPTNIYWYSLGCLLLLVAAFLRISNTNITEVRAAVNLVRTPARAKQHRPLLVVKR